MVAKFQVFPDPFGGTVAVVCDGMEAVLLFCPADGVGDVVGVDEVAGVMLSQPSRAHWW